MQATFIYGEGDIRVETTSDPEILTPLDALVRVVASCVCGSDLHPYRGTSPVGSRRRIGHEFVGVVEEIGVGVRTLRIGQFVIAPFVVSDGTCRHCTAGIHTSCVQGAHWGQTDAEGHPIDGGQGEFVRVPLADGTLVGLAEQPDSTLVPDLLTLSDVMCTGHHAARSAGVVPGASVVVVGDGAVGLSAVLAARRLGAERIIIMSAHGNRAAVATEFGATDVVELRGREGAAAVSDLLGGSGADCVLECVGGTASLHQAVSSARAGGRVGYVGSARGAALPLHKMFFGNISVSGGVAPARAYIEELLGDVLDGSLRPGAVFDTHMELRDAPLAYRAMDERTSIKVLLTS